MPDADAIPAHDAPPGVAHDEGCLRKGCDEAIRLVRTISFDGRVVSVVCQACGQLSLYQYAACQECGAETGHTEACSFATPWGV